MNFLRKNQRLVKGMSLYLAFTIFGEIFYPTMTYALTSGPASPEFSSFEPVATTDMVDPFSGEFTYNLPVLNIPGADGGGYAMSLSYHSGASSEEESSWVGFGWTLNAGAINRGKIGYPDEFNGVNVRKFNKTVPNWTVSAVGNMNIEYVSQDKDEAKENYKSYKEQLKELGEKGKTAVFEGSIEEGPLSDVYSLSYNRSVRFNNYSGVLISKGFASSFSGIASLNMNFAGGNATFGFSVNPMTIILRQLRKKKENLESNREGADCSSEDKIDIKLRKNKIINFLGKYFSMNYSPRPTISYPGISVTRTHGRSFNFSSSLQTNIFGPVGMEVGYKGNFNVTIPESETILKVSGYKNNPNWGSMNDDADNSDVVADYFIDGETNFTKTDKNLGIPFSGADVFSATGEGMIGGFRFHSPNVQHYYPTKLTNKEEILNIGLEFGFGQTIQVGLDIGNGFGNGFGNGWHKTVVDNWDENKREVLDNNLFKGGSPFLQFMNDPGTSIRYTDKDGLMSMELDGRKLDDSQFRQENDNTQFSVRTISNNASSNIQIRTQNSIDFAGLQYFDNSIETQDLFSDGVSGTSVRQVKITKPDGSHYIYGVPVMAKNELNLSVGLSSETSLYRDFSSNASEFNPFTVTNDHVFSGNNVDISGNIDILKNQTAVGELVEEPYSTSWLLTQIVTPDYVDINDNGPDDKDYGGWTKFTYRKKYGGNGNNWYRHRAPYNGLFYNKGRLHNAYDQTGSFSTGQKEVVYLKTIETKTHIAFFVTNSTNAQVEFGEIATNLGLSGDQKISFLNTIQGSGEERYDGLDAKGPNSYGKDYASQGKEMRGDRSLDKLEKIVLFSKAKLAKPLSVTHFEYSYELCKGIPNNSETIYQPNGNIIYGNNSGKLTLKKVWTDTEGLAKARISPYKFEYSYNKPQNILPSYADMFDEYTGLNENPTYKEGYLDAWGNYQDNDISKSQRENFRSWMYQGELPANFDPAAWNLKRIILPSGGEIHIQYEQKDYCYVQDKQAMTMLSIKNDPNNNNGYKYDENKYYVNLEDVGIGVNETDRIRAYFLKIAQHYFTNVSDDQIEIEHGDSNKSKGEMLYFKFLYNYVGETTNLGSADADDFVEGYCPVNKIGLENGSKIYIQLGGSKKEQKYLTPRRIAYEQALSMGNLALDKNNKLANLHIGTPDDKLLDLAYVDNPSADYETEIGTIKDYLLKNPTESGEGSDRQNLRNDMGKAILSLLKPSKENLCQYFNPEKSYFKLVVPKSKRGGGLRVKRLLMYNPGIENGETSLYGSEYIYKTKDGRSSGVATNEPGSSREENALVDILPKYKQGVLNKLMAGRDKSWAEGPLGEHLLPQESVGHSRVVIKNIHSGKSSAGFVINEYLTCKQFPTVQVKQTELKNPEKTIFSANRDYYKKSKFQIPLGLINYSQDKAWLAQGYLFTIDDKHGLLKSTYTYNGNYSDYVQNPLNATVYASVQYEYTNEPRQIINGEIENEELVLTRTMEQLGAEEDMAMYASRVEDRTFDFSVELDLNFLIAMPPVFTWGFGLSFTYDDTELSQHVTSRVIRNTTKLKKTISYADGIRTTSENIAYSGLDGSPIVTKVSTAYDSPEVGNNRKYLTEENVYYSMSLPAAWIYPTMGKVSNGDGMFNMLTAQAGSFTTHLEDPMKMFVGDNEWKPYTEPIGKVIAATAIEFKNNRFEDGYSNAVNGMTILNQMDLIRLEFGMDENTDFDQADLTKMNSFYYPVGSYTFIGDRSSANKDVDGSIYTSGIYKNFQFFKWHVNPSQDLSVLNPNWQSPSYVTKYSPNGQPLEEVNLLGIYSAVHFGYNYLMPTISGVNAEYETILFEDYEIENSTPGTKANYGHTGKKSLTYSSSTNGVLSNQSLRFTQKLASKGARVKLWVRLSDVNNNPDQNDIIDLNPSISINQTQYPLHQIARVGDWVLLQTDITDWNSMSIGSLFYLELMVSGITSQQTLLIDDLCFHPLEAGVSMTVYNPSDFRVVAQLGDQHFATLYEYNDAGQLVRTIIETERGRKTVKEQQINTPKVNRYE